MTGITILRFFGEQSLDRRSEGEIISIIRGRIIVWIIEPHTESWVDETGPGYAHLPTIRSSTVRGMLPKIAYTTTYGGWCPTTMGALTKVRHCVDSSTQPLLSAASLLWTPIGREQIELAGHELAIHMLESAPCTLVLRGQVVKQRASDIEELRKYFSQGLSAANPSKLEARIAVAFIAPELSPEPSVQTDTRAAIRLYVNRLSPASVPKTEESVIESSSDLIAAFSPRVILVAPTPGAAMSNQMLVRLRILMVDALALATAQLMGINNYRDRVGTIHDPPTGWSQVTPRPLRLRESRIRRVYYAFRSKWWWARPSSHSLALLTWSTFAEIHGLTGLVKQVDEELSDYSASAREDLERFIALGGLTLGSLAIYESVIYAEMGSGHTWLTIGMPAVGLLRAITWAALRPVIRRQPQSVD